MISQKQKTLPGGRTLTLELLRYFKENLESRPKHTIALRYAKGTIYRRVYEAERIGYIKKSGETYHLTPKGNRLLNEDAIWNLKGPQPKKWDHKWHLVLFDIPTKRRKYRDILRLHLKTLGFVLYQNSVWVHPHPLEEVVSKIATFYFIERYISFAVAETLTGQETLVKKFQLQ